MTEAQPPERKPGPNTVAGAQPRIDGKWARGDETRELTELQAAFAVNFTANGGNAEKAAVDAGYSAKSAASIGSQLLQLPWVRAAIDRARGRLLARLDVKSLLVLDGCLDSTREATRLKAAELVQKAVDRIADRQKDKGNKPLNQMDNAELEEIVKRGMEALAAKARPILQGQAESAPSDNAQSPDATTSQPVDPAGESTAL